MHIQEEDLRDLSIVTRFLVGMTRLATDHPWTTVWLAVLLSLASIYLAQGLELRTGKLDMIPPGDPQVVNYLAFSKEFGTMNRLLAVVDGPRCQDAAVALAKALRKDTQLIRDATARLDMKDYISQYLYVLLPGEVRKIRQRLEDSRLDLAALVRSPSLTTLFRRNSRQGRLVDAPEAEDLERLRLLVAYLLGRTDDPMAWVPGYAETYRGRPVFVNQEGYFVSKTGQKALVMISPMTAADRDETRRPLIRLVRQEAQLIEGSYQVHISLTGEPALKDDEARAAAHSLIASSLAALVSVVVLFLFAFRRRALPLLAVLCLMTSMLWTLAWARYSVPYLTVVSTSFTAILIGLGVDFAIHLISRFEERRRQMPSPREALIQAATEVASGVLTGALTTSAAFFSMLLVGFPAFRGLGIVAGGGILFAVLETFSLLPAIIILRTRNEPPPVKDEKCPGEDFFYWLSNKIMGSPSVGVMMALSICILCLGPASRLKFDTNLLRMNNPNAESMKLQDLFLGEFGFAPAQNAVTYKNSSDMIRGVRLLEGEPAVGFVDSLAHLLPLDPEQNKPEMVRIRGILEEIGSFPNSFEINAASRSKMVRRLSSLVGKLRLLYLTQGNPTGAITATRLQKDLVELAEAGSEVDSRERAVLEHFRSYLQDLHLATSSDPNLAAQLPERLLQRFHPKEHHVLFVAPSLDVRQEEEAQRFTTLTENIAKKTHGNPTGLVLLTRHMVAMLERGYLETCLYSFLAVFVLLLIDLRRLDLTLISLGVCGMGILALRASMSYHGIPLNAANFIAIPLLLGVGVDNAVHILHPWMRGVPLNEVLGCSGRPITMNAMTSTLGFGGLLFAEHQGLYSLGWAMAVGVIWCMVATFLLLPGILSLYDFSFSYWERLRGDLISHRFR
jgi:predicted RND superfamily exporter protein